jgi:hypothetical protein
MILPAVQKYMKDLEKYIEYIYTKYCYIKKSGISKGRSCTDSVFTLHYTTEE